MKKYQSLWILLLFVACNNAGEPTNPATAPDTVVIDTTTVNDAKVDGTEIDAEVLDTTIRR